MSENTSNKKPLYKKWWFIIIIVIVVFSVLGSLLPDDSNSNDEIITQTPTPQETTTPEPTPIPEPEPEHPSEFTIGDTAVIGNWEVTLNSFEFVDRISTSDFFGYTAAEGNQYLYAVVTVTNLDSAPRTFLPMLASGRDIAANVIYDDNFTFTRSRLMTYREDLEGRTTNPLAPTTGSVIFTVADRAVESDGSLTLRFFNNREEIFFVLR